MPILAKEPSVYPEWLLEEETYCDAEGRGGGERQWWLVYTKVKQEKALARQLLAHEVPFYLPLIPREHLYRGQRVRAHVPLFTGYLFLYADDEERSVSLTTNRITKTFIVQDPDTLLQELQHVNRLIEANAPLTLERRLTPGQRVRIRTGPFAGTEGVLTSRRGSTRLLVGIEYIGQGVSVEIDDFQVESI